MGGVKDSGKQQRRHKRSKHDQSLGGHAGKSRGIHIVGRHRNAMTA
jgi:hypothetical protein